MPKLRDGEHRDSISRIGKNMGEKNTRDEKEKRYIYIYIYRVFGESWKWGKKKKEEEEEKKTSSSA